MKVFHGRKASIPRSVLGPVKCQPQPSRCRDGYMTGNPFRCGLMKVSDENAPKPRQRRMRIAGTPNGDAKQSCSSAGSETHLSKVPLGTAEKDLYCAVVFNKLAGSFWRGHEFTHADSVPCRCGL